MCESSRSCTHWVTQCSYVFTTLRVPSHSMLFLLVHYQAMTNPIARCPLLCSLGCGLAIWLYYVTTLLMIKMVLRSLDVLLVNQPILCSLGCGLVLFTTLHMINGFPSFLHWTMHMKENAIVIYSHGTGFTAIIASESIVDNVWERVQEIDLILSRCVITTTKSVISFTLDNQFSILTKMQSTSSRLFGDISPLVFEIGALAYCHGGR
jgi:hypothetical protein